MFSNETRTNCPYGAKKQTNKKRARQNDRQEDKKYDKANTYTDRKTNRQEKERISVTKHYKIPWSFSILNSLNLPEISIVNVDSFDLQEASH